MLPKRVMNTEAMTTVNMMGFITSNYHPVADNRQKRGGSAPSHCFNDTPHAGYMVPSNPTPAFSCCHETSATTATQV